MLAFWNIASPYCLFVYLCIYCIDVLLNISDNKYEYILNKYITAGKKYDKYNNILVSLYSL